MVTQMLVLHRTICKYLESTYLLKAKICYIVTESTVEEAISLDRWVFVGLRVLNFVGIEPKNVIYTSQTKYIVSRYREIIFSYKIKNLLSKLTYNLFRPIRWTRVHNDDLIHNTVNR